MTEEPTRIIIEITDLSNVVAKKAIPIIEYKYGLKQFARDVYTHDPPYPVVNYSNTSLHMMRDY